MSEDFILLIVAVGMGFFVLLCAILMVSSKIAEAQAGI